VKSPVVTRADGSRGELSDTERAGVYEHQEAHVGDCQNARRKDQADDQRSCTWLRAPY